MSHIHLAKTHDNSYPPPRGHVLLLSCMDPRLLDDTVDFMEHDNLANRYDHVILAGAALGALGGRKKKYSHWRRVFFDHLEAAHKLHEIEDVYILEHRNCGAYHKVFKVTPAFGDSKADLELEASWHRKYANLLEDEILAWAKKKKIALGVRSFLMGIRGDVSPLDPSKKSGRRKGK